MIIWAKTVRIFNFYAYDVNKSLRRIVVSCNICSFIKNYAIDQGEVAGTTIRTETDNEVKYQEEIDNAYNKLVY